MDLKKNIFWAGLLRGLIRGMSFVKTIILARLLLPSQFGVFGIATLVLGLLEMLTETGVNVVLIQEEKDYKKYLNTGFAVSILRGLIISMLIFFSAPFVSSFFNSPGSINVLHLISLIPLIRGFINPAVVSYQKNLQFDKEFILRSILTVVEVATTLILAIVVRNETSLAWGMIASAVVEVLFTQIYIKPRPRFDFDIKKLLDMVHKGKWITGAKIFDYLFSHGDDIVVGKLLGSYSLGIYQQAYRITSLPIIEASETLQRVTFPHYTNLINQNKKIKNIYFKSLTYTLFLVLPVGVLIYLFPEIIVRILLGEKWLEAIPVLQVLAVFCIVKTLANSVFPILLARKRQDLVMYLTIVGIFGLGLSIYPLTSKFGLVGAGMSTLIGSLLMLPPAIYWTRKYIDD